MSVDRGARVASATDIECWVVRANVEKLGSPMPLSWNEIRDRSIRFVREWENESSEHAEAKSFWDAFFDVFGVSRRRLATFETPIKKADGRDGFIDLLWKGMVVVEHKSRGKNLDAAYDQALGYTHGLSEKELPRYVIVSDFARFRVQNLDTGERTDINLADLPENLTLFSFIAGYEAREYREQDPVNIEAAKKLAELHDALENVGYEGHSLEVYLVRLLFCLFADDTGIFMPHSAFEDFIRVRTSEDGSDLAPRISQIFETLDTPPEERLTNLDEQISAFPYVNGKLFEERLHNASFDKDMRRILLDCCELDWGTISPAILGSLFQGIMNADLRRNLGAHYTSEKNILKVIEPLFMEDLWAEFHLIKTQKAKLAGFHEKLANLNFLDPACGCGNFLVISYRELRLLELAVIKQLHDGEQQQLSMDAVDQYVKVNVDQFYGIEIEEWPAQIARVAMWLVDHQMNLLVGKTFGQALVRVPLVKSANITNGNALRTDWSSIIDASKCSFLIGNPPFRGHQLRDQTQVEDMELIWGQEGDFKRLDYVACWYKLSVEYMRLNNSVRAALVSTNSICQGEQASTLWPWMLNAGVAIHSAHRTFQWTNEAKGVAAVHCIIISFGLQDCKQRYLFDYGANIKGDPVRAKVSRINPYLVDGEDTLLQARSRARDDRPRLTKGSQATDDGNLFLSEEERNSLIAQDQRYEALIRRFIGAAELTRGTIRYCFWLVDCPPQTLGSLPELRSRLERVRDFRLKSPTTAVNRAALTPALFTQIRQPVSSYIGIPRHSSSSYQFIPTAYFEQAVIAGDAILVCENASISDFGILNSTMLNAWARTVAGRIKNDIRFDPSVYNNFPWPTDASEAHLKAISTAAQNLLAARSQFPEATLAQLYDPLTMPPALVTAHQNLDKAVDMAYVPNGGKRSWVSDAERVAFLFQQYHQRAD